MLIYNTIINYKEYNYFFTVHSLDSLMNKKEFNTMLNIGKLIKLTIKKVLEQVNFVSKR